MALSKSKRKYLQVSIVLPLLLLVVAVLFSFKQQESFEYPFQNPSLSFEERVNNLVSLLTIDEKIEQMTNNAPAIKRLGIPAYNWWNESLHGVARSPYHVTSYPQAIGMAATWDTSSLKTMANYCAIEGRAIYNDSKLKGKTGIYLGLTYWTPNINIFRDPRWGRGQETYGEDPFLTGSMGMAFVNGLQGNHPTYLQASACAKHFAVHSGPEWNRSTFNAKVSDYDLWDTYLPAFKNLIVDAKVSGVMCAYNALDGQPCCGSDRLMNTILRNNWKFDGYVTSDCGGIGHFYKTHKTHATPEAAAADAVLHGTDCECSGKPTYFALKKAIADGLITEQQIDVSVKRLFIIRMRLGMFDPEAMVPFSSIGINQLEKPAHQQHALKMAQQSLVLLKNSNNLLPLSKKVKKIAVIGPNADDESVLLSNYYGYPSKVTSVLEGIKNKVPAEIVYIKGTNLTDNNVFISNYQANSLSQNGMSGFEAKYYNNTKFEGKPALIRHEDKIDNKWGDGYQIAEGLIARNISVRWTTTFTPTKSGDVTFEIKGDDKCRLYIDTTKCIDTDIKNAYYTLKATQGKLYKITIDYVQYDDNAEVKFDMGLFQQQQPNIIAKAAAVADVIIFVGGISAKLEGEDMPVAIEGFKGGDRTNINLPKAQTALMQALKATGKPLVFINMSGGAIGFEWEAKQANAIIQAWYGGQAGGQAIADVLFGDYNPAGRLPITFYKSSNDLPDFEDYSMSNRSYRYFKGKPLYPFGFGLSYTNFGYSDINITQNKSEITIATNITNLGKYTGDEVVQLYVSNTNSSMPTAIRTLKGFKRLSINKGSMQKVVFTLKKADLTQIDAKGNAQPLRGKILFSVGGQQPIAQALVSKKVVQKYFVIK